MSSVRSKLSSEPPPNFAFSSEKVRMREDRAWLMPGICVFKFKSALYVCETVFHARHHAAFANQPGCRLKGCFHCHYRYGGSKSLTCLTSQGSLVSRNQGSGLVALASQGNNPVTAEEAPRLIGHWCRDSCYGHQRVDSVGRRRLNGLCPTLVYWLRASLGKPFGSQTFQ